MKLATDMMFSIHYQSGKSVVIWYYYRELVYDMSEIDAENQRFKSQHDRHNA